MTKSFWILNLPELNVFMTAQTLVVENKTISYLTDKDKSGRNTKGETGETTVSLKSWLQEWEM